MGPSRCLRSPAHSRCSGGALEPRKESRLHSSQGNTESADLQRAGRVFPVPEAQDECGGGSCGLTGGQRVCAHTHVGVHLQPEATGSPAGARAQLRHPSGHSRDPGYQEQSGGQQGSLPGRGLPPGRRARLQSVSGPWTERRSLPPGGGAGPALHSLVQCERPVSLSPSKGRGSTGPGLSSLPRCCPASPGETGPCPACWTWSRPAGVATLPLLNPNFSKHGCAETEPPPSLRVNQGLNSASAALG